MIFNTVNEKSPSNIFGYTPLHTAAESGRLEVCKFIIETNKDPEGERPIHLAADNGHLEIFKFNIKRSDRETPLELATEMGHEKVCKLLKEDRPMNIYKL